MLMILVCILSINGALIDNNTAYWTLDNTLDDSTGNNQTLTNVGATYTTESKINGSYYFDGNNDYMNRTFTTPDLISINMWVNISDINISRDLLSKHKNIPGDYGFVFGFNSANYLTFFRSTTGNDWAGGTSNSTITSTTEYQMISLTYDGVDARMYINGNLDSVISLAGDLFNSNWVMSIGARKTNAELRLYLKGSIDEVGLWSRALNASEILTLYNNNIGLQYPYIQPIGQITFENITVNNNTFVNNSYFNTGDLEWYVEVLNTSTNGNIDIFYTLYNSTDLITNNTKIAENSLNTNNYIYEYININNPQKNINGTNYFLSGFFMDLGTGQQWCIENNYSSYDSFLNTVLVGNYSRYTASTWSVVTTSSYANRITCYNQRNFAINNLIDDNYNISFFAENNEINVTTNLSFTIDTTLPIINLSFPDEYNYYDNFNISQYINVTDIYPNTCIVDLIYNGSIENTYNCTEQSADFNFNGNYTFNVTATDLANNTNTATDIMLINPFNYFYFDDESSNPISNFSFGGNNYTDFATIKHYDLGLDTHTLTFQKLGFVTENFTFTFNTTNQLNITYNVTTAKIIVNIYDRTTGLPLNNSVNMNILGLGNQTTINGTTTFENFFFAAGNYSVQTISIGYETEQKDFTYSRESLVIINMYMLEKNLSTTSTLYVPVTDEWDNIISGSDTRLLEYDFTIFGFKEVSQCYTDSNGECQFLVEVGLKTYIITTQKVINGILYIAQSSIDGEVFQPEISGGEEILGRDIIRALKLKISDTLQSPDLFGLIIDYPVNENSTIVSKNSTTTVINIPVSFSSTTGISYTVCLELYRIAGSSIFNVTDPVCLTSTGGILPIVNINLNNIYDYEARVTVNYDGETTIYKTYLYPNNKSFIEILKDQHIVNPFVLFFWITLLSLALYLRSIAIWVYGAWTLAILQLALFPGILFASASISIIIINAGVLYMSKRQGDLQ